MDLTGKLMTAKEAVEKFVHDGDQVSLGGFTLNRNPMSLVHEMIRQGRKDLYLVCHSHGQAMDLLVGAGCVSRMEIAYGGMGRFAPTCIRFRRAVQRGQLALEDYSNYQMSLRFLAGAMGLPMIATKTGLNTDIVGKEGFDPADRGQGKVPVQKLVVGDNPFAPSGDKVVLLPALNPDVALMHAQQVGTDGTVRIKGLSFADLEQARAADRVLVTCEQIVPREQIRQDPDQNSLPGFLVDAVVHAPLGAHPTACHYFYDYDPQHLKMYGQMAVDDDAFRRYLDQWIHGSRDFEDYLAKLDPAALERIKADPVLGYAPGLDRR
ncbi:MAG: CoA transferase subunit A [Proteobacteria bacterium]|nr:CoA transferase subunit A [Pseudomonadota bacterium]MBU1451379.1 CoA transferase subunit A [Pseudomonadota bacterium]MBU2467594.1 CoA transferase subunit A [Pseudomonadota bacterium]MBU2519517.1 CoA transferase subunit A [Pseudomonadota bacterium]